jgi:WD40 repeat protein
MTSGVARWSYRPPRSFGFLIVSPIALAVSKAGDVAIATDAGRMSVWTSEGALKSHWWDNDSPRLLSFANGEGLLGTDSFTLASWKAATGRKQHRQKLRERAFGFAATPDGARACIRTIHHVELIDTGSNEVLESYPLEFGPPLVTISSGGDIVAFSGLNDITVRRVGTDHVHRLQVTGAYVRSLKLSPDGRSVAAGCSDGTLRFWNLD